MKNWIIAKDYEELRAIIRLLRKYQIDGTAVCYQLSDPRYIFINFEKKEFHLGCRFPSRVDKNHIMDLSELICFLAGEKKNI